jgi:hypothetical protein
LALTGFLFTLVVGWLPGTPNHDGTRQFVYVFVSIALLGGTAADSLIRLAHRKLPFPRAGSFAGLAMLCLGGAAFWVSLEHEPWGLSYYSEWIGGTRGAWRRGFELTYWCETFSPSMIRTLSTLIPQEGSALRVHCVPKLDYLSDGADCLRAFLPPEAAQRRPFSQDVVSALFTPWAKDSRSGDWAPILAFSFNLPPDAILISYRRASVGPSAWNLHDTFARQGELMLMAETVVDGVVLARLYSVPKVVAGTIPADPQHETWYQIPAVAERMKRLSPEGILRPGQE